MLHWMDLGHRSTFQTVLSRGLDPTAHGLQLAPAGSLMAATQGASCEEEQAMVVDQDGAHPALAAEHRTDARARLARREDAPGRPRRVRPARDVVRGGVEPRGGRRSALVDGVTIGAPRTVLRNAPTEVPTPPNQAPPAPPGGVG